MLACGQHDAKQRASALKLDFPRSVGPPPEVPDALQARGQHVKRGDVDRFGPRADNNIHQAYRAIGRSNKSGLPVLS